MLWEIARTHARTPCLPLFRAVAWGNPKLPPRNLNQISQLYHNSESLRSFFCSYRATELCTLKLLFLHADSTVDLSLIHR